MQPRPLADKIALVTGGGHRLGRAIAIGLAHLGCDVIIHYGRSEHPALETVKDLTELGVRASAIQADLSDPDAIQAMFTDIDRLDILINSAGVFFQVPFLELDLKQWQAALDINLTAPFLLTQQAAKRMATQGVIINISDIGGSKNWIHHPSQSVSKGALNKLTQVAARALAPNIRVNAVAPGLALKPDDWSDSRWNTLGAKMPLEKPGTPDQIVDAVLFLIRHPYITGEILHVDGGDHLR